MNIRPNLITAPTEIAAPITYDSPHSVMLSIRDWHTIQMHLAHAACLADERDEPNTAERIREALDQLRDQNMEVIEAAAEADV